MTKALDHRHRPALAGGMATTAAHPLAGAGPHQPQGDGATITALANQHRPTAPDHPTRRRDCGALTTAAPSQQPAVAGRHTVDERLTNSEEATL